MNFKEKLSSMNVGKYLCLFLWIGVNMPFFFLLNKIGTDSFVVFVVLIFGCNMVYDVAKELAQSDLQEREEWLGLAAEGAKGVGLLMLSFMGLYIEASAKMLAYFGLAIWLISYCLALNSLANLEKRYKAKVKKNI